MRATPDSAVLAQSAIESLSRRLEPDCLCRHTSGGTALIAPVTPLERLNLVSRDPRRRAYAIRVLW